MNMPVVQLIRCSAALNWIKTLGSTRKDHRNNRRYERDNTAGGVGPAPARAVPPPWTCQ